MAKRSERLIELMQALSRVEIPEPMLAQVRNENLPEDQRAARDHAEHDEERRVDEAAEDEGGVAHGPMMVTRRSPEGPPPVTRTAFAIRSAQPRGTPSGPRS